MVNLNFVLLGGHCPPLYVGFSVRPSSVCPRKLLDTYFVHDDNDDDDEQEEEEEETRGRRRRGGGEGGGGRGD